MYISHVHVKIADTPHTHSPPPHSPHTPPTPPLHPPSNVHLTLLPGKSFGTEARKERVFGHLKSARVVQNFKICEKNWKSSSGGTECPLVISGRVRYHPAIFRIFRRRFYGFRRWSKFSVTDIFKLLIAFVAIVRVE